jgi:protein disulfide-isomerase
VFSTAEFKDWAKKNVILVEVDFPRRTEQPDDLKKQNMELKNRFAIRGYPTILFLDANEKVMGKSGYRPGGPDPWIKDAANQIK